MNDKLFDWYPVSKDILLDKIVGQIANLVLNNDDSLYESYMSGWYSWVSS